MQIDWSLITNKQFQYFQSKGLPLVEVDVAAWHYWAFYCPVSTSYNQSKRVHQIEGVFFARETGVDGINQAFHVPGTWLSVANGVLYQILHDRILTRDLTWKSPSCKLPLVAPNGSE